MSRRSKARSSSTSACEEKRCRRKGAVPAQTNNFQGRYAVRHVWTGPIACKNPHRGVWGGKGEAPTAARDLAFAPRGKIDLASILHTSVSELGIDAKGTSNPMEEPLTPSRRYTFLGAPLWVFGVLFGVGITVLAFILRRRQKTAG